ncbi:MAG: threonine--tRNA ligase [Actinobacteria bacterium]|nr:MAG: threonine--tRNA ligase [Actinomycetota bacterium]
MEVVLPDGSRLEVAEEATVLDVARAIGPRLASDAIAGRIDDRLVNLTAQVHDGAEVEIFTKSSEQGLEILRHSAAHVMAQAVSQLFGAVKLGVGPATDNGFYYDFDLEHKLVPEDLGAIEKKMAEIVAADLPFSCEAIGRAEAGELFAAQPYKLELIEDIEEEEVVTVYRQGGFADLCRGPHAPSTGWIKAFKLQSIAGAYWRGDEKRPMLQRVYGTAFFSKKELDDHLKMLEEAAARDHRRLGKELDLFSFQDIVGSGLVLYHPKGATLRQQLIDFMVAELSRRGYLQVVTPHIYKADVWKISGHYDFYRENMYFFEVEDAEFGLKPMNCPGHVLIYKNETRSYRDLPIRYAEMGTVYRNELSGVVHGLMRARGFTQDDAHIFCRDDQLKQEIKNCLDEVMFLMKTFDFGWSMEISTKPEKSIGEEEKWAHATDSLMEAAREMGLDFDINEGEGAFYGPKIDVKLRDAIGRTWQCATIQVDFNFPERFELEYMTADNKHEAPYMIHRAIFGSMERFIGILVEHYAGAFPAWLAPVQAVLVPIADRHVDYCRQAQERLRREGLRAETYAEKETMGAKIRRGQLQKVPYMLVVGDREVESGAVAVRRRDGTDLGDVPLDAFIHDLQSEVGTRR